ncbi:sugar transferase [Amphritea opalescens]|uniref:Sugar transferase n=1 Tax=Amphritea opalescens TaxID=2490544 RepID=A0A430KTK0_9GAMM|nr:sugar transferase [Amphritea opalescens]RTE66806.1 sugar transferase [Amphritea opalescens]
MFRVLDIILSLSGLILGMPVLLLITLIGVFDTGSPIFCQQRVGRNKQPFTLVKFRTMKVDTASVATHLADRASITAFGAFLRRTKLDELPQLWNVLIGDMSLVGPRPGLFNQAELTAARESLGIYDVRPGITGLAQVNQIDMSTPQLLAEWDHRMIQRLSLKHYFRYLLLTVIGQGAGDRVR